MSLPEGFKQIGRPELEPVPGWEPDPALNAESVPEPVVSDDPDPLAVAAENTEGEQAPAEIGEPGV